MTNFLHSIIESRLLRSSLQNALGTGCCELKASRIVPFNKRKIIEQAVHELLGVCRANLSHKVPYHHQAHGVCIARTPYIQSVQFVDAQRVFDKQLHD